MGPPAAPSSALCRLSLSLSLPATNSTRLVRRGEPAAPLLCALTSAVRFFLILILILFFLFVVVSIFFFSFLSIFSFCPLFFVRFVILTILTVSVITIAVFRGRKWSVWATATAAAFLVLVLLRLLLAVYNGRVEARLVANKEDVRAARQHKGLVVLEGIAPCKLRKIGG
jgi:membrane-associated HD superfamily phosphohydrolase